MIKLEKNLTNIPVSLIPAFDDLFASDDIPVKARTTHGRRLDVINRGSYIDEANFNSRYKESDIKLALNNIYNNKCAFCEYLIEQPQVEHYRPKSKYHWLAFSWDNLLLACAACNQGKGVHFALRSNKITFINNEANIRSINISSTTYDVIEQPLMINPEVTDPEGLISFQKNGAISSEDERFAYTIEKCSIDRSHLNDQRRKLLEDFDRDIQSILVENNNVMEQRIAIETIVKKFLRDSKDVKLPFLAFRRYAIKDQWLNDIIKGQN